MSLSAVSVAAVLPLVWSEMGGREGGRDVT